MVVDDRKALGDRGEQLAAEHLESCGFEVLERNWRCRAGELDLVAREGGALVAVEVKTRRSRGTGHPLEALTPAKVARLRGLMARWLAEHRERADEVRIDAVAVWCGAGGDAGSVSATRIEHVRGVGW